MKKFAPILIGVFCSLVLFQAAFSGELDGNSSAVMLQGFHWESHMSTTWWDVVGNQAQDIGDSGFDMIWLPPSSKAASDEGYLPNELYVQTSGYGTESGLKQAIANLHQYNVKVIADIVINHRVGTLDWADFTSPEWGSDSVCGDDEWPGASGGWDTGDGYGAARDIDHTQTYVQDSLVDWMNWLKSDIGYDGWRYDYVKGYSAYYNGIYNDRTDAYFSVGELWTDLNLDDYDAHRQQLSDWINGTGGNSAAFDFTTKGILQQAVNGEYWRLEDYNGGAPGLIGWWPAKAVTFLDNHDTGPSTGGAGGQNHWPFPADKVMQGYAYILTHPGIPMVYWVHFYDWGLHDEIESLINLRKEQGINSTSSLSIQAADSSKYAAIIDDKVAMKIGGGDWNPGSDWTLSLYGDNYAVWTLGSTPTNTNNVVTNGVRTVVFMYKETVTGQDIFIKGGHDAGLVPTPYPSMSEPIIYNNTYNSTTASIKAADASLDWGTESALDWTCDSWPSDWGTASYYATDGYGEDPENTMGTHWWKFDVQMTGNTGDWYEFKAFMREGSTEWWESDRNQSGTPYDTINHWGKKGYITKCIYNDDWVEFDPLGAQNNTPNAEFTVSSSSIILGESLSVDASNSSDAEDGSDIEFRWDWNNDGTYDTDWSYIKTDSYTFSSVGTYSVKLEVRDSEGSTDTKILTVNVTTLNNNPVASFTVTPETGIVSETSFVVDASASSDNEDGPSVQVRWDWENNGTYDTDWSTEKTAYHTFTTVGSKTINLQVKDSAGAFDTATLQVTVEEGTNENNIITIHYENSNDWANVNMHWGFAYYNDVSEIAMSGSDSFGVYSEIEWTASDDYLTACFNDGNGWWDGNDRQVDQPGSFPAEVWIKTGDATVYTDNPNDSEPPVVALTAPAANATLTGETTLSANASDNNSVAKVEFYYDSILIDEDVSAPYSITWDSAFCSSGTHSIVAKAYDAAGNTASDSVSVVTSNPNIAPVANAGGAMYGVLGVSVQFSAAASFDPNGEIVSYSWTDGEGGMMSGVNPIHTYNSIGDYSISLTVTDDEGATDTTNILLSVSDSTPRGDFREETIYFLITTRFFDGDTGNNYMDPYDNPNSADDPEWRGDFKGLVEKLDYLKALGFTAVWITPVVENQSGYDYHGYHGYDFYNVDSRYESDEYDFQRLVNEVHGRGMKLVLDIVLNHSCNMGAKGLFEPVNDESLTPHDQFVDRVVNQMFPSEAYHDGWLSSWDSYDDQSKTIAGDCVDFDTENETVRNYLIGAYDNFIDSGVDAFRIDTTKHISRYTFNQYFIPAFKARGGDNFYMFGEVCSRVREVWNRGIPAISPPFFTWKESTDYSYLSDTDAAYQAYQDNSTTDGQPTSDNHYLWGNDYHTPDYSMKSGLDVIDFTMHWNFENAGMAFSVKGYDMYYNDATWNVVYVDSHDYGPDNGGMRYNGGTSAWAENMSLMWTFRGIPCLYYGSEIEFMAGVKIDEGKTTPLANTGRAYFGDYIEGDVDVIDFGIWQNATGEMANTLNSPLSKHLSRLNRIRLAIPALQKGQYSTDDISGGISFKRRYTDSSTGVDSFVLVTISGGATFNNIPNGTYVDAVTGDTIYVSGNSLTADCWGQGNMRVYVLDLPGNPAPGKIGDDTEYLY